MRSPGGLCMPAWKTQESYAGIGGGGQCYVTRD